MTIEVKQLLIKSSVLPEEREEHGPGEDHEGSEDSKACILEECRQMVIDMLRKERER